MTGMAAPRMDLGGSGFPGEMVAVPARGRTYTQTRRVGLGDVDPTGRLRLDALAAALQDVATADYEDSLAPDGNTVGAPVAPVPAEVFAWVVRRLSLAVVKMPVIGERMRLVTFAGGIASRWAERRTQIVGEQGALVEAAAVWVCIDGQGRPSRVGDAFVATYGEAAGGREVSARLVHAAPPEDAGRRPWPLRRADLDTLGHVNNAAHWQAVEEIVAGRTVTAAQMEFRAALAADDITELLDDATQPGPDEGTRIATWLVAGGEMRSSALVQLADREPTRMG